MSLTVQLFMTLVSYEALVRRSSQLVWNFVSCGGRLVLPHRGCCCWGAWSLTAPRSYLSAASLTRSTGLTGDTVLSAQQLTLWWWEDMADKRGLCLNWFCETRGLLMFYTYLNLLNICFTSDADIQSFSKCMQSLWKTWKLSSTLSRSFYHLADDREYQNIDAIN